MSTEVSQRPPTIDPPAALRWARLAPSPDAGSPWLHEEIGRRMADRLQWIKAQPRRWLDWAPLRGGLESHALVTGRYRAAEAFVVEPAVSLVQRTREIFTAPWWTLRRWQGPRESFDVVPDEGVDLLWANMALHMAADPQALIAQWHRLTATDGFLMFSCFGPDTLRELRTVYQARGWPVPAHQFTDMHDWGDMLVAAGFAEPVMDMERIVLTYATPEAALAELRTLGRNLHPQRFGALRGKAWRAALTGALASMARPAASDCTTNRTDPEGGRIAFTFEIIYGHAFKPVPRIRLAPESAVSLREMRSMLGI